MSFFYLTEDATAQGVGHDDDVAILVAGGEIDYAASPQFRERIAEAIGAGMRLVVDLSPATFIDSTAIGALVGAVMRLREHGGGSLAVVCSQENEQVLRTFDIAGVTGLIALYPSREAALLALAAAD
ncbi:MAG: anti-sigma factor antagonist [Solirubrobacterales bacterium]|nr:anti-sigma factor antagonist [Solirubrobacterales bacterium]